MNLILRRSYIFALLIALIGFLGKRYLSSFKEEPKRIALQPPLKRVSVARLGVESHIPKIPVTGRLISSKKIDLFTEVNGRLLKGARPIKDGVSFKKGEAMFRLFDRDLRMNLLSQKANFHSQLLRALPDLKIDFSEESEKWQLFINHFDPEKPLPEIPEITNVKERNFLSSINIFSLYYTLRSQEEQLKKYTIYAPFDGTLNAVNLNPGTLIRTGQKIGELVSKNLFELETTLSMGQASLVSVGNKATFRARNEQLIEGKVMRISKAVDPSTQTIKVFISLKGDNLFEGDYWSGHIEGNTFNGGFKVPNKVVLSGDRIYQVIDSSLVATKVGVIHSEPDSSLIGGIDIGALVPFDKIPGAYDGMKVFPIFQNR